MGTTLPGLNEYLNKHYLPTVMVFLWATKTFSLLAWALHTGVQPCAGVFCFADMFAEWPWRNRCAPGWRSRRGRRVCRAADAASPLGPSCPAAGSCTPRTARCQTEGWSAGPRPRAAWCCSRSTGPPGSWTDERTGRSEKTEASSSSRRALQFQCHVVIFNAVAVLLLFFSQQELTCTVIIPEVEFQNECTLARARCYEWHHEPDGEFRC